MGEDLRSTEEMPSAPTVGPSALLDAVSSSLGRLRVSERKVARVVLENPEWTIHASVADLARRAGVSEPTVIRFCTTLGFRGFKSFRLLLTQSLALGIPATQSVITADDSTRQVVSKVFDYFVTSLDHARRVLDVAQIERAVDALAGAREILFIGLGTSNIVTQDAQQRFFLFGVPCSAPLDAHLQFIAAALARPETVVVAISHTGRTTAILECATAARENGATLIAICGAESPLSNIATIPLIVETLENTDFYTPTISRLAHLVVIDILATSVALRHTPEEIERLRRMKHRLSVFARVDGPVTRDGRSLQSADGARAGTADGVAVAADDSGVS